MSGFPSSRRSQPAAKTHRIRSDQINNLPHIRSNRLLPLRPRLLPHLLRPLPHNATHVPPPQRLAVDRADEDTPRPDTRPATVPRAEEVGLGLDDAGGEPEEGEDEGLAAGEGGGGFEGFEDALEEVGGDVD